MSTHPDGWKPTQRPAEGGRPNVTAGVPRLTAYAISLMDLEVVGRATVRAMLGPGRVRRKSDVAYWRDVGRGAASGRSGKNHTSVQFQGALKVFEDSGWIRRGERYVLVLDHRALLDYAVHELDCMPSKLLDLEAAVEAVHAVLEQPQMTDEAIEQAHREIAALRRLMRAPFGGAGRSGRGSVRRVGPGGSGKS